MSFACFFFFKQKTAYEMRISDWSSDVCSSDLVRERYGFMWFWAGDGDADVGLLPHFPQYESDGYGVGIAYKHVAGSYQLLIDNLLDLSHAPFVHKGLLGDRNTVANWDFSYDQGPRHIVDRRFFAARPAVQAWAKAYGAAFAPFDGPMDHSQETYWYAPANMPLDAGLVMPDRSEDQPSEPQPLMRISYAVLRLQK